MQQADATPASATDDPQLPADFVAANPWLFGTVDSFRWFVRRHKAELIEAGALIRPTGRDLVVPSAFKQAALVIGARRAKAS